MYSPQELENIQQEIQDLLKKASQYRGREFEKYKDVVFRVYDLALSINDELGLAEAKIHLSFYYFFREGNYEKALGLVEESLVYMEKHNQVRGMAWGYTNRGVIRWGMGDYDLGFTAIRKSCEVFEELNDIDGLAWGTFMLGGFSSELKDFENSKKYHEKSLDLFEKMNDKSGYCTALVGLSSALTALGQHEKAFDNLLKALKIAQEIKNKNVEARALHEIGAVYEILEQDTPAQQYFQQALDIRRAETNVMGIITSNLSLGRIFMRLEDFTQAKFHFLDAAEHAQKILAKPRLQKAYFHLAELYKKIKEPYTALDYYEKYMELQTQVMGEETEAKSKNLQIIFNLEKSKNEAELHKVKNIELREANEVIEAQTRQLVDSILYAQRIQEAILPSVYELEQYADNSFLMYKPKDIVSGDMYWFTDDIPDNEEKGVSVITAVDCTGHGVPGAFMVVLATTLLNGIVKTEGITEPAEILHALDQKVQETLHQGKHHQVQSQDGMDMAVITVNFEIGLLKFAGAKNSLFLVRNGVMQEIKGSPFPIGGSQHKKDKKVFEQHIIQLEVGDNIYMATDGFQDQFGGENNMKFMKKNFRDLLFEVSKQGTPQQQRVFLENIFENWRGKNHQTDDVLVMGIRFTAPQM